MYQNSYCWLPTFRDNISSSPRRTIFGLLYPLKIGLRFSPETSITCASLGCTTTQKGAAQQQEPENTQFRDLYPHEI